MLGDNPKRGAVKGSGQYLDIQEIFPTIQGEGPRVGTPSIFIRLGGCNLACTFCDTEFESFSNRAVDDIVTQVMDFSLN